MRNRAFDGSAHRTDLVIVFVFTRVEFTVLWLLSLDPPAEFGRLLWTESAAG